MYMTRWAFSLSLPQSVPDFVYVVSGPFDEVPVLGVISVSGTFIEGLTEDFEEDGGFFRKCIGVRWRANTWAS